MKRILALLTACLLMTGVACKKKSPSEPSGTVTSVVVSGNASYVNKNQTSQLTATANMTSGAPQDVTATATWSSNAATIASVGATGLVTALNHGAATISAASGGQTGTLAIAVVLKAQPQLTVAFNRLCGPHRARMESTISETSNNAGMNINSLTMIMKDFFGVVQYNHTFSAAEISGLLGSNHINAGQSRIVAAEQVYTGGVDTEDSTGSASVTTTDDFGNALTTTTNVNQRDGC